MITTKSYIFTGIIIGVVLGLVYYSDTPNDPYQQGDLSDSGGTPTLRNVATPVYADNPFSTNDESNDQAVGFYGTETMHVCNQDSGSCYYLDVDSDGENVERIYFPKGGWVDLVGSDCDDQVCFAMDENGTQWVLEY